MGKKGCNRFFVAFLDCTEESGGVNVCSVVVGGYADWRGDYCPVGNEDVDCGRLIALCGPTEGCYRWVRGLVAEKDVDVSIDGDAHVAVVVLSSKFTTDTWPSSLFSRFPSSISFLQSLFMEHGSTPCSYSSLIISLCL